MQLNIDNLRLYEFMLTKSQVLTDLLNQLKHQMQQLELWQTQYPSEQALASTQPFCVDTLSFAQWLQFVFITKIEQIIHNKGNLPSQVCVCPMAEESFKLLGEQAGSLINIIADIDELLSGQREQTKYVR